jgi:protein dithiol oxidoreductase (disulfide-forming)
MQRRAFTQAALTLGGTGLLGVLAPAQAQVAGFREGSDFRTLERPAPIDAPAGQIEVIEFFAYTCVHCHHFEPLLKEWIKTVPAQVSVRRSPVGFNAAFEPLQRLYFTLEGMGKLDTLHDKVFLAIHEERQRLNNREAIVGWAQRQGLDKNVFGQMFDSFGVSGKVRRATQLQDAYQVEATPSLGIAGRYYVPGQAARTLSVANALIASQRKG